MECPLFSRSLPLFARSFFKLWFWKIQLLIEGLRAQRKHGWAVLILILDTLQAKFGDWRLLRIPLWIKTYAWSYIDERAVVCSNGCILCACVKAQLVKVDKGTSVNNSINTSSRVGGDKAGSQTTKRQEILLCLSGLLLISFIRLIEWRASWRTTSLTSTTWGLP